MKDSNYYCVVPGELLENHNLKSEDLIVYMIMIKNTLGGKNTFFGSHKKIVEEAFGKVCLRNVPNCLKRLEDNGIIKCVEKKKGQTNKYMIIMKPPTSKLDDLVESKGMQNMQKGSAEYADK